MFLAGAVTAAVICFLVGANSTNNVLNLNLDTAVIPRTRVLDFQGDLVRFDSSSGAVLQFSGNTGAATANGTWIPFVRPLAVQTSGVLQLQHTSDATFLVDIVRGDSWILRVQNNTGNWQKVRPLGGGP